MKRPLAKQYASRGLSWWIVLVAGALAVFFAIAITRELIRSRQVSQQVKRLNDQVSAEEDRHQKLSELISYLSSQTFQEREARLKLGLKKAGEKVVVVPPNTIPDQNGNQNDSIYEQPTDEEIVTPSNIDKWWQYFFKRST